MTSPPVTHVVLLTPEGRAAVASILVAGPAALSVVGSLFHPASGRPLADLPPDAVLLGRWLSSESGEQVIVCRRTEERIEIHCHGGAAAAAAILNELRAHGIRQIDWRAWIRQAGRSSMRDAIAAEARIALAQAPTDRAAAVLWDQYHGALADALDRIARSIEAGDAQRAIRDTDNLLAWSSLGRHLLDPWRVVLAGRPNVGKSSLTNALVGYERALVHPTPGTTRDIVTVAAAIDGWPIELTDTAGLREGGDAIESTGIRLARERLTTADLVVLVFDASSRMPDSDQALAGDHPAALRVFNKCDLIGPQDRARWAEAGLLTSATLGEGIAELHRAIAARLVLRVPAPGQAVPFLATHAAALAALGPLLAAGDLPAARERLSGAEAWLAAGS